MGVGISWLVEWVWGSVGWKTKGFSRIGVGVNQIRVKVSGMDVDINGMGAEDSGMCVQINGMGVGVG